VQLSRIVRAALIVMPLATTGVRIHAHALTTPYEMTQELNCCGRLVRLAAARRNGHTQPARPSRNFNGDKP